VLGNPISATSRLQWASAVKKGQCRRSKVVNDALAPNDIVKSGEMYRLQEK